ncbi:MAG: primosomal protein N' [Rhizomicrobium sp.]
MLLPLPLPGAYDYKLPKGTSAARGLLVCAPLGPRAQMGVVWGAAEGGVGDNRLKEAVPLEGYPAIPSKLCDFVDWVANYTLSPPGLILAMVLRSGRAFAPEALRTAFVRGGITPAKLTPGRARALAVAEDGLARSVPGLAEDAGVSAAVVRGLIDAGALVATQLPEFAPFAAPDPALAAAELSAAQRLAADALIQDVKAHKFAASLLDGVTGSGKTEVYFEAVAEALRQARQVLILLPEIALTVQFLERFAERFGCRPAEWHSDLSQKERTRTYRAMMNGEAKVVVGARSSLFLPFRDLGLIIVDEEHEQAYKQEDGAIYHARDMAVVRARTEGCAVVLASATPSLETYVNAVSGRYALLKLPRRHGAAVLPQTRLIDLRHEKAEPGTWLSQPLRAALANTLAAGEQAMLFLNRRGYAPLTLCESCGHKMACRDCSSWLVEHRYRRRLACHQCGYETATPPACPACGAQGSLIACGPGVERVAEEFRSLFPQARVAIASSDTMHGPNETQAAIRAMARREIDVLIGDPDRRQGASLSAVDAGRRRRCRSRRLGRRPARPRADVPAPAPGGGSRGARREAGRGADADAQSRRHGDGGAGGGDRDAFYEQERVFRERAHAPPFGRLAAIILSGTDPVAVIDAGKVLAKAAPSAKGVTGVGSDAGVLSPAARPDARAAAGAGRAQGRRAGVPARLARHGEAVGQSARRGRYRSGEFFLRKWIHAEARSSRSFARPVLRVLRASA